MLPPRDGLKILPSAVQELSRGEQRDLRERNCLESEGEEGLTRAALISGDNTGKWHEMSEIIGEKELKD